MGGEQTTQTLPSTATFVPEKEEARLAEAIKLLRSHMPPKTTLTVKETDGKLTSRYIFHLQYTSTKSRRTMTLTAKTDSLPQKEEDHIFRYIRSQLYLTPKEVGRAFGRLYFRERRARQEAFLRGENGNIRVTDGKWHKDRGDEIDYFQVDSGMIKGSKSG